MTRKLKPHVALGAALLASLGLASTTHANGPGHHGPDIDRVLLISIDGMHAVDFANCASGLPGVNSGNPYCPNLAALGLTGVTYVNGSTSKPSDSFPGLMTLMTGSTPRTMGVYYDISYDRSLNPPSVTSLNGNPAGACTNPASGTTTEYDEGIDIDKTALNGGAPSPGDGGVSSINPSYLIRDKECNPVYPWNFVRTNTIYGVIHAAHGYTAWADKHPSYSSVGGPTGTSSDSNVDDYYGPEINSTESNFTAVPALLRGPASCGTTFSSLPDQNSGVAADDYTGSFQNIQCYDGLKVSAILNEIDGLNHNGSVSRPVPQIFGMNFQAVSIGQKLIYQHGTLPSAFSTMGGYQDNIGTPTPSLFQEIVFVDNSIGLMVSELKKKGLYNSTLIIITAKHGQSPIDSARYIRDGSNDPDTILSTYLPGSIPASELDNTTEDDVALIWLTSPSLTASAVATLESKSPATPAADNIAGIGQIFSGPILSLTYNTPGVGPNEDPRTPDIIVTPNIGVTYSNSGKKLAEHGGFAHDDTNVMMLVENPVFRSTTITSAVTTAQVAPTILQALGLDPNSLQAVQQEGTPELPGLFF